MWIPVKRKQEAEEPIKTMTPTEIEKLPPLLTRRQAAEVLQVDISTINKMARRGELSRWTNNGRRKLALYYKTQVATLASYRR